MATEKRLISLDEAIAKIKDDGILGAGYDDAEREDDVIDMLESCHIVDAVPIDEIKFLYMAINKNGIPELKVQLGDRILCLRRENDPVDVVPVVRCKDCKCRNTRGCPYMNFNAAVRDDSDYCSDGERKDNG